MGGGGGEHTSTPHRSLISGRPLRDCWCVFQPGEEPEGSSEVPLAGFICCGSGGVADPLPPAPAAAAAENPRGRIPMSSVFGPFNDAVVALQDGVQHSNNDWLSRDPAVGVGYGEDPLCCVQQWGDQLTVALLNDIGSASAMISSASFAKSTPSDLPILILNGERDPVVAAQVVGEDGSTTMELNGAGHGMLVDLLVEHAGCTDVTEVLYREARHELMGELDDVKHAAIAEILAFVDRACGEDAAGAAADYRQRTMGWGAGFRQAVGPKLMEVIDLVSTQSSRDPVQQRLCEITFCIVFHCFGPILGLFWGKWHYLEGSSLLFWHYSYSNRL